jgi:hypothetical protein
MGLDMYLTARKYISDYGYQDGVERDSVISALSAVGLSRNDLDDSSPGVTVEATIGYWRKANQIHNWFVQNVQGGVDECQESYVSREQLEELHRVVTEAITKKDSSLLPPVVGFFFGGTEVDEWYWRELEETSALLNRILNNPNLQNVSFYYQASW